MPIVVKHEPDQSFAALIALLQAQQEAERQRASQPKQVFNNVLPNAPAAPRERERVRSYDRPSSSQSSASAGGGGQGRDRDRGAAAFYNAGAYQQSNYDPNAAFAKVASEFIQGQAGMGQEALRQSGINQRSVYENDLKPLQDAYEQWATAKIPDEVAEALAAGRAEYSPKQLDERNKIIASISEAQGSNTLTPRQRYAFLAQQAQKLYEIDSRPMPTTADKWVIPPQEQFDKGRIWNQMPDGSKVPYQINPRYGTAEVDPGYEMFWKNQHEMEKVHAAEANKPADPGRMDKSASHLHTLTKDRIDLDGKVAEAQAAAEAASSDLSAKRQKEAKAYQDLLNSQYAIDGTTEKDRETNEKKRDQAYEAYKKAVMDGDASQAMFDQANKFALSMSQEQQKAQQRVTDAEADYSSAKSEYEAKKKAKEQPAPQGPQAAAPSPQAPASPAGPKPVGEMPTFTDPQQLYQSPAWLNAQPGQEIYFRDANGAIRKAVKQ